MRAGPEPEANQGTGTKEPLHRYQHDQHLCLYWGTPHENKASAWCERLPGCEGKEVMRVMLNKAGRLVGKCGQERAWTAGLRERLMPNEVRSIYS